jgi:hypothetical protein
MKKETYKPKAVNVKKLQIFLNKIKNKKWVYNSNIKKEILSTK